MSSAGKRKADTNASQRSAKQMRVDYNETIVVLFGPEEKFFVVHRDIIAKYSHFFKAAFSTPHWIQAVDKKIRLKEATPGNFAVYPDWLHLGELNIDELYQQGVHTGFERGVVYQQNLFQMYFLADFLQDLKLCNRLMI